MAAWKVGLFVVCFGALVFAAYVVLGRSMLARPQETYFAEMKDAAGIAVGSRVLMSGVQVGTVEQVALARPTLARLTLKIDKGTVIPNDSRISVSGSLIGLGDTPLQIVAGSSPGSLPPNSILTGSKASPLESLAPEAAPLLAELKATLEETKGLIADTRKIVNDREMVNSVKKLLASTERTVSQYGALAGRIDGVVAKNQGRMGDALTAATLAMNDIRLSTKAVSQMITEGKLTDKTVALVDSLTATTEKAGLLVEDLRSFVNDPELRGPLAKAAANTEKITDSGVKAAKDLEDISKNGVVISKNTAELTEKAKGLADDTKTLLDQLKKILGKGPSTPKVDFSAGLDVMRDNSLARNRTDISATIKFKDTPIHVGLFDAFESNRITAQLGRKVSSNTELLYGIYASKPGAGVEYEVARGLALRADVFDLNSPRLDLRARWTLGGGFFGWIGANQVFKRNALLIGFGFRK